MTGTELPDRPDWLPAELHMVAYELARVDDLGWQIFEATIEFSKIGIIRLADSNSEGVRKTSINRSPRFRRSSHSCSAKRSTICDPRWSTRCSGWSKERPSSLWRNPLPRKSNSGVHR